MLDRSHYRPLGLEAVYDRVLAGERLSLEDGLKLFQCPDLTAVGALAHARRTALHGDRTHFVVNRHVNYTNVCVNGCTFCAYRREDESQAGAFKLSITEALGKIAAAPLPPNEIHVVGGCHPTLPLSHFEEMLSAIKSAHPQVELKCFTAVEIAHFAALEEISTREVLARLKGVGLDMLPGGGAEVFDPEIRTRICPRKLDGEGWLRVHREAHELGIKSNCTLLFGHIESYEHRLDHLDKLRRLQDETGGFVCFIPLPFLIENNELDIPAPLTGMDELRMVALSRLMLDNIPHIKAYWVMLGVKQAQTALHFGADDLDGTVVEEKIGHEAGAESDQGLSKSELKAMIRGCGFTPVERTARFKSMEEAQ